LSDDFFDYEKLPKVAYSSDLARAVGGVKPAIFLSQLLFYIRSYMKKPGRRLPPWFSKGREELEDATGLTRSEQESARRQLRELGILEERKGAGYRNCFRIRCRELYKLFPAEGFLPFSWQDPASWPAGSCLLASRNVPAGRQDPAGSNIREDKKETAKPGPVQAELAFADKDDLVALFKNAPFPWKKKPGKEKKA